MNTVDAYGLAWVHSDGHDQGAHSFYAWDLGRGKAMADRNPLSPVELAAELELLLRQTLAARFSRLIMKALERADVFTGPTPDWDRARREIEGMLRRRAIFSSSAPVLSRATVDLANQERGRYWSLPERFEKKLGEFLSENVLTGCAKCLSQAAAEKVVAPWAPDLAQGWGDLRANLKDAFDACGLKPDASFLAQQVVMFLLEQFTWDLLPKWSRLGPLLVGFFASRGQAAFKDDLAQQTYAELWQSWRVESDPAILAGDRKDAGLALMWKIAGRVRARHIKKQAGQPKQLNLLLKALQQQVGPLDSELKKFLGVTLNATAGQIAGRIREWLEAPDEVPLKYKAAFLLRFVHRVPGYVIGCLSRNPGASPGAMRRAWDTLRKGMIRSLSAFLIKRHPPTEGSGS